MGNIYPLYPIHTYIVKVPVHSMSVKLADPVQPVQVLLWQEGGFVCNLSYFVYSCTY